VGAKIGPNEARALHRPMQEQMQRLTVTPFPSNFPLNRRRGQSADAPFARQTPVFAVDFRCSANHDT
jgi:hypothetical protein